MAEDKLGANQRTQGNSERKRRGLEGEDSHTSCISRHLSAQYLRTGAGEDRECETGRGKGEWGGSMKLMHGISICTNLIPSEKRERQVGRLVIEKGEGRMTTALSSTTLVLAGRMRGSERPGKGDEQDKNLLSLQ